MSGARIWESLFLEAPRYNMDNDYLVEQGCLLGLDDEDRLLQLWKICEEHAESVFDLFEAFEFGVINRQQVEQVLTGKLPIERVRLFMAQYRQQTVDALEASTT